MPAKKKFVLGLISTALLAALCVPGCVKGTSVFAVAELGKGIERQYAPSGLSALCNYYNEKIVPKLGDSSPETVWNCETIDKYNAGVKRVSELIARYAAELEKTLKVKENEEVRAEVEALFELMKRESLTERPEVAEDTSETLAAIADAANKLTDIVFAHLRASRTVEAIQEASGVIDELQGAMHAQTKALMDNELAWGAGLAAGEDPGLGFRVKKLQAAIMADIQSNNCDIPMVPPNRISCTDACTGEMRNTCEGFVAQHAAAARELIRFDSALKAFQAAHARLAEEAVNLKKVIKDKELDGDLKDKIIADAKAIYKAASQLVAAYGN